MTLVNGIKVRKVKCGKCACQVDPFQNVINDTRNACAKGFGCGLHRISSSVFPMSETRPTIHLPVLLDKKVTHILEPDCGDCCSHTPLSPANQEVADLNSDEFYEIEEPIVIEQNWNPPRGRKGRRK